MIKRWYFFSAQYPYDDNNGSYGYRHITIGYRSWFPDPNTVFKDAYEKAKKDFEKSGRKVDALDVQAFNRI